MKPSIVAFVSAFAILAVACGAVESSQPATSTTVSAPSRASTQSFGSALDRAESVRTGSMPSRAELTQLGRDDAAAASYCVKTGGTVFVRTPEYNTNSSHPLLLAGRAPFCQYTATTTGASRIHILLTTLYSQKPSLAALAYILAPPPGSCGGNPASCYCTLLGASDQFGGAGGAGGSWVNAKSPDQNLEACVFPDGSSIDSWGLTYHAHGIIRGIDLTKVMRYKYTS